ncbi:RNA polymerase sigma factor [Wenzhouxiangella sp. EGI_FJ10409]|uniref:RNA polymerase sigma factor n=1 Tax=Wenzhouxiangella sp. EGI_FJ10409 TaxID=3243767 RepID=UPI0035D56183
MRTGKERALDAYLAASARTGSRSALDKLAGRWQRKLLAHAHRMTGEADLAADVVQEAWTDILRGIGRLDDVNAFPAWAFRIVTRRCARAIRGRQRRRAGTAALARDAGPTTGDDGGHENRADLAVIRRAMAELPAEQRAALGLFYLEGLRVAEIAVALDVAPGTVKTRLMHARNWWPFNWIIADSVGLSAFRARRGLQ